MYSEVLWLSHLWLFLGLGCSDSLVLKCALKLLWRCNQLRLQGRLECSWLLLVCTSDSHDAFARLRGITNAMLGLLKSWIEVLDQAVLLASMLKTSIQVDVRALRLRLEVEDIASLRGILRSKRVSSIEAVLLSWRPVC
jgi:hypothetical protein